MIPWRGRLRIRTYNPGKLIKYGILVRMVSEATTGYICNMEIYAAEGKKLEDTIFSVLELNLDLWHHVYQDNYSKTCLKQTPIYRKPGQIENKFWNGVISHVK
jgi:hypothetical protein